jgi:hypothetical protein
LVDEIPFVEKWAGSGHNDAEAEAFRHWDEDDPAVVSTSCAKCHSTPGYLDFLGVDGSEAGVVDADAEIGTTVECVACHNDATLMKTSVVMPSGLELTDLGDESRCMECHQGRESKFSVDARIEEVGLTDSPDTVSDELGFANIHYYAAAATKYGTQAMGGYEYEGKTYDGNFAHVEEFDTCIECHDMHTLEVRGDACAECHTQEEYADYRMPGSLVDYDGDGDIEEGIFYETQGLQEKLYSAIQAYGNEVAGTAIVYDSHSYPYFFIDTNADGEVAEDEAAFPNRYASWTPRLLKAAYNYQVSLKDPGEFAHGGKYIIQLLWDSIEDLNEAIASPIELADTHGHSHRIDMGHFAGSEEAFRHWDEDGEVPGRCSRCHSATGLPLYIQEGVEIAQPLSNGFQCRTCHNDLETYTRYEVSSVEFPSGAVIDSGDQNTNLCMNCHQGRSSTFSVRSAVGEAGDDDILEDQGFINIHYFAAGATRFGTEVQGAYEFEGKEYIGLFEHVQGFQNCTDCHDAHKLQIKFEACSACHNVVETYENLHDIRISTDDFDGDGDASEGIAGEIETLVEDLYSAMQAYATDVVGTGIVYDAHSYPYFFDDAGERFTTFTPSLLKAAYNYQYAEKDPGGFAHNGKYIIQLLIDSIEAVDGDVSAYTRPTVGE